MVELAHLISAHSVLVAAIPETKLSLVSNARSIPNYTLVPRHRPGEASGGGLAFLIHHSVSYTDLPSDHLLPNDSIIEHQAILAHLGPTLLQIVNFYIPPATSCPTGYLPDLDPLFERSDHNVVIVGDFNAHSPAWFSSTGDDREAARGAVTLESLDPGQFMLLNEDLPTRLPTHGNPSSPDLTLISGHLALDATWLPLTRLNFNHLPIAISLCSLLTGAPSELPQPNLQLPQGRLGDFLRPGGGGLSVCTPFFLLFSGGGLHPQDPQLVRRCQPHFQG